jgi:hypothetical protein
MDWVVNARACHSLLDKWSFHSAVEEKGPLSGNVVRPGRPVIGDSYRFRFTPDNGTGARSGAGSGDGSVDPASTAARAQEG